MINKRVRSKQVRKRNANKLLKDRPVNINSRLKSAGAFKLTEVECSHRNSLSQEPSGSNRRNSNDQDHLGTPKSNESTAVPEFNLEGTLLTPDEMEELDGEILKKLRIKAKNMPYIEDVKVANCRIFNINL